MGVGVGNSSVDWPWRSRLECRRRMQKHSEIRPAPGGRSIPVEQGLRWSGKELFSGGGASRAKPLRLNRIWLAKDEKPEKVSQASESEAG